MILAGAIERPQMGRVFSCASFFHISILSVTSPSPAGSGFSGQIGRGASFVDEDKFRRVEIGLPLEPIDTALQHDCRRKAGATCLPSSRNA